MFPTKHSFQNDQQLIFWQDTVLMVPIPGKFQTVKLSVMDLIVLNIFFFLFFFTVYVFYMICAGQQLSVSFVLKLLGFCHGT